MRGHYTYKQQSVTCGETLTLIIKHIKSHAEELKLILAWNTGSITLFLNTLARNTYRPYFQYGRWNSAKTLHSHLR